MLYGGVTLLRTHMLRIWFFTRSPKLLVACLLLSQTRQSSGFCVSFGLEGICAHGFIYVCVQIHVHGLHKNVFIRSDRWCWQHLLLGSLNTPLIKP